MKIYIGIDNGTTGSISIVTSDGKLVHHAETPKKSELGYQKSKAKFISRINFDELYKVLARNTDQADTCMAILERPMITSFRFNSSVLAARALEATLICLESLSIPYRYIDSKEWQGVLLPPGCAKERLKLASDSVTLRLYPEVKLAKAGDGDSVLIAHYAYTKKL